MQFTTALLASAAALTASALPQAAPVEDGKRFGVVAIRSGSPIQNLAIQAAHADLMIGADSQGAGCDAPTNSATFYLSKEELYLHTGGATPQKIFVDRSGMGQGNIGYITGAQPLGRNWETKGWAVSETNELKFDGTGLQACPGSPEYGWSVWLQGLDKPGWNENCTSISNLVVKTDNPIGCWYTQQ